MKTNINAQHSNLFLVYILPLGVGSVLSSKNPSVGNKICIYVIFDLNIGSNKLRKLIKSEKGSKS